MKTSKLSLVWKKKYDCLQRSDLNFMSFNSPGLERVFVRLFNKAENQCQNAVCFGGASC
jgi:hypothetical protein